MLDRRHDDRIDGGRIDICWRLQRSAHFEHLGQMLLALFVVLLGALQLRERKFVSGVLAMLTAAAIVIGTGEGLMLAVGQSGEAFALVTIAGFVGLTLWLIATGIGAMRGVR